MVSVWGVPKQCHSNSFSLIWCSFSVDQDCKAHILLLSPLGWIVSRRKTQASSLSLLL